MMGGELATSEDEDDGATVVGGGGARGLTTAGMVAGEGEFDTAVPNWVDDEGMVGDASGGLEMDREGVDDAGRGAVIFTDEALIVRGGACVIMLSEGSFLTDREAFLG
jgi:hypothetical protein